MKKIIGDQRERGIAWASQRLDTPEGCTWEGASALFLETDGEIIACVLYDNWYPRKTVDMSVAALPGTNWLNREFLRLAFWNPFVKWQMGRVTARIAADNAKSIRFAEHLGFVSEGRLRDAVRPGTDLLMYGMLKRECRYLPENKIE